MNATLHEQTPTPPESFSKPMLELDVEDLGHGVFVGQVHGEAACSDQAGQLEEQLRSFLRPGLRFLILDLAEWTRVDQAVLATLGEFSRDLRRKGAEVWLTGLQPAVWLGLHVAGLDRFFTIRSSLAEALAS